MAETFNQIHLIRQVDLFTLKLFMAVMEERQVGRAAARENIAASAATKRIQDLEEIVGVRLFERNPRGVVPTAAGQVLARHLSTIFGTFEDLRRDLNEFGDGVRGAIRIASTGGIISQYLAREIAEFARGFPLVDINLREAINLEVPRIAAAGEVDVGVFIAYLGTNFDHLDCVEYRRDRLVAAVHVNHALADRQHVKVMELLDHNLIALTSYANFMAHLRQTVAQAGVEFKPKYTVSSIYAATSLVRVGQGVMILPENLISVQDQDWVRTIALDEPWALRRLLVAAQRDRSQTAATRNFIAQLTARPA
jgi:DNA-binding transcriptional LysR family regulator